MTLRFDTSNCIYLGGRRIDTLTWNNCLLLAKCEKTHCCSIRKYLAYRQLSTASTSLVMFSVLWNNRNFLLTSMLHSRTLSEMGTARHLAKRESHRINIFCRIDKKCGSIQATDDQIRQTPKAYVHPLVRHSLERRGSSHRLPIGANIPTERQQTIPSSSVHAFSRKSPHNIHHFPRQTQHRHMVSIQRADLELCTLLLDITLRKHRSYTVIKVAHHIQRSE